jgi:hypothetical protein
MKLASLILAVLLSALRGQAHRLDECLQATRVTIKTNRVDISIDITPGVAVADQFQFVADRDQDGQISSDEAAAYARSVLKEMPGQLDGRPVKLELQSVTFPKAQEMKSGLGVIRIKAGAKFPTLPLGDHLLNLTNNHLPSISVYLVNALKTNGDVIMLRKQSRDPLQREYQLEFSVNLNPVRDRRETGNH